MSTSLPDKYEKREQFKEAYRKRRKSNLTTVRNAVRVSEQELDEWLMDEQFCEELRAIDRVRIFKMQARLHEKLLPIIDNLCLIAEESTTTTAVTATRLVVELLGISGGKTAPGSMTNVNVNVSTREKSDEDLLAENARLERILKTSERVKVE